MKYFDWTFWKMSAGFLLLILLGLLGVYIVNRLDGQNNSAIINLEP